MRQVIASVYTTAMVIIGFLWIMNDTIRDNNRILTEVNKTLMEIRDGMKNERREA